MNKSKKILFSLFLAILLSFSFLAPHKAEASIFSTALTATASVFESISSFFGSLFGSSSSTSQEQTTSPIQEPQVPDTSTSSDNTPTTQPQVSSSPAPSQNSEPVTKYIEVQSTPKVVTQYVYQNAASGISEKEFVTGLQNLENRLRGLISSSSGGGYTVPPNIQPSTFSTVGNLTSGSINPGFGDIDIGDRKVHAGLIDSTDATFQHATTSNLAILNTILLTDVAPLNTTNQIYSNNGNLYWSGNVVAGSIVGNWASNGTDAWRPTGNIGIGSTSPTYKLSVGGTTFLDGTLDVTGEVHLATTTISGGLVVIGNTTITQGGQLNVGDKIIAPGEIGLGTSTPYAKLAVQGTNTSQPSFVVTGADSQTAPLVDIFNSPTSNTNVFRITNSGNVGIGKTNPGAKLDVNGDITASGGTLSSSYLNLSAGRANFFSGSELWLYSPGNQNVATIAANTTNVVVNQGATFAGNVGIGRTDTNAKLDVNGTIKGGMVVGQADADFGLAATGYGAGGTIARGLNLGNASVVAWANNYPYYYTKDIGLSRYSTGVLAVGNGTQGDTTGTLIARNIGIGKNNPSTALDVVGDVSVYGSVSGYNSINVCGRSDCGWGQAVLSVPWQQAFQVGTNNNLNQSIGGTAVGQSNTLSAASTLALGAGNSVSASGAVAIGVNVSNNIANSLMIGPSDSAKLTILSNGYVGIGTTNPSKKLDVYGNGIRVESTDNTNYLFEGHYNGGPVSSYITGEGKARFQNGVDSSAYYLRGMDDNLYKITHDNSVGAQYYDYAGHQFYVNSPSIAAMTIVGAGQSTAGYVGIGTTSPSARLSVLGNNGVVVQAGDTGLGTTAGIGFGQAALGSTNYSLMGNGSHTWINAPTGNIYLTYGGGGGYSYSFDPTGNIRFVGTAYTRLINDTSGPFYIDNTNAQPILFRTSATERARFDSNGNLGIGTTNPLAKLDVAGNTAIAGDLSASNVNATGTITANIFAPLDSNGTFIIKSPVVGQTANRLEIRNDQNNAYFSVDANGYVGTNRVVLGDGNHYISNPGGGVGTVFYDINAYNFTGGNVGIGTTSPAAKISVAGSASFANGNFFIDSSGNEYLQGNSFLNTVTFGNGNLTVNQSGIASQGYLYITAGSELPISAGGAERVRISTSGNVGIGTTNPTFPLSLGQGLGNRMALYDNGNGTGYGFGMVATGMQIFTYSANDTVSIGYGGSSSNFNETLTVKGSNVGIGTTTPHYALSVVGNINYTGTLTNNAAADIAENYPTTDATIEAGDVVMVDTDNPTSVVKAQANKAPVIGIITTKPAITLGSSADGKAKPVALAGRVPVKFSSENGEASIGDSLTVSKTKPGYAMKVGSTTGATTVIGTVLDNRMASGTIEVFVRSGFINQVAASLDAINSELVVDNSSLANDFAVMFTAPSNWMHARFSAVTGFFKNIFADSGTFNKLKTKELCVDDVCVTKDQFKAMVLNGGVVPTSASTNPIQSTVIISDVASTTASTTDSINSTQSVSTTTPPLTTSDEVATTTQTTAVGDALTQTQN